MPGQPQLNPWRYATLGLELVGGVGLLIAAGYGVDRWLGTAPWGLITGALVGIVGGLYKLVRDAMRTTHRARRGPDGGP